MQMYLCRSSSSASFRPCAVNHLKKQTNAVANCYWQINNQRQYLGPKIIVVTSLSISSPYKGLHVPLYVHAYTLLVLCAIGYIFLICCRFSFTFFFKKWFTASGLNEPIASSKLGFQTIAVFGESLIVAILCRPTIQYKSHTLLTYLVQDAIDAQISILLHVLT